EWATATETNNNGFELQRSLNGVEFNALTFVKSKAVNGSSASRLDYSFSDTRPYSVNSYYRLKQVDIDGKVSYSNIVVVKGNGINSLQVTNLYPNPVRDNLNVVIGAQASARVTLSVMDISGKVMMQKIVEVNAGDNIISLNAASFAPGSYVLSVSNSLTGETFTTRFIK
ncbi:MAG: C-terminal target protein, partial [Chitinophagaceae bacterium]|nr:C-terminal target protein [Chitinophagaceae bacterium]